MLIISFLINGILTLLLFPEVRDCFIFDCSELSGEFRKNGFEHVGIRISFVVNLILLIIGKYIFLKMIQWYNWDLGSGKMSPMNFSLRVSGIPKTMTEEALVKDLQKRYDEMMNLRMKSSRVIKRRKTMNERELEEEDEEPVIEKANFIYDISRLHKVIKQDFRLDKEIYKLKQRDMKETAKYKKLLKKRKELDEKYQKELLNYEEQLHLGTLFTGKAFVTFRKPQHATKVFHALTRNFLFFRKNKTNYSLERAPEPIDVLWENFGKKMPNKTIRRLLAILVTIIVILISLCGILVIKYFQLYIITNNLLPTSEIPFDLLMAVVVAIFIVTINFIMRKLLLALTWWERRTTQTSLETSVVYKTVFGYFINVGVVVIIANYILVEYGVLNKVNIFWSTKGIVVNIIVTQFFSIFADCLVTFFDLPYWIKKMKKIYYTHKVKNPNNRVYQFDIHKAYEGVDFEIAERYYMIFKMISVTLFFQSVIPYLLLFGLLELILTYWTMKYLLIRRCKRPVDINFKFSLNMGNMMDMMTLLNALGYLVFEIILTGKSSIFAIVVTALTLVYCLLSMANLFTRWFGQINLKTQKKVKRSLSKRDMERMERFNSNHVRERKTTIDSKISTKTYAYENYNEISKHFPFDYDRLNPVTLKKATEKWLKLLDEDIITENPSELIEDQLNDLRDDKSKEADKREENGIDVAENINAYIHEKKKSKIDLSIMDNDDRIVNNRRNGRNQKDNKEDISISFLDTSIINNINLYEVFNKAGNILKTDVLKKRRSRLRQDRKVYEKDFKSGMKRMDDYIKQQFRPLNNTNQLHNTHSRRMTEVYQNKASELFKQINKNHRSNHKSQLIVMDKDIPETKERQITTEKDPVDFFKHEIVESNYKTQKTIEQENPDFHVSEKELELTEQINKLKK